MATLVLAGEAGTSLTHMVLLGSAAIVRACIPHADVTVHWQNQNGWRAVLEVDGIAESTIGAVIAEHAAQRSKSDSWVNADLEHEGRTTAVFSPRIKGASSRDGWNRLQTERLYGIDKLPSGAEGALDMRLVQSLGEPAYWRQTATGPKPDDGASRLEMKTRNRGEEFVQNRLRPLAVAVSDRTSSEVIDGLTGGSVRDEVGKNKADSRSGTGFVGPGPVDNALAWCALWGIAQFPVIQKVAGRSATCGFISERGTESSLAVPMAMWPVTLTRMRSIMLGPQVMMAARRGDSTLGGPQLVQVQVAADYLRKRGIGIVMRFPWWSSSGNAPEFRLLSGTPIRLGSIG